MTKKEAMSCHGTLKKKNVVLRDKDHHNDASNMQQSEKTSIQKMNPFSFERLAPEEESK